MFLTTLHTESLWQPGALNRTSRPVQLLVHGCLKRSLLLVSIQNDSYQSVCLISWSNYIKDFSMDTCSVFVLPLTPQPFAQEIQNLSQD